MLVFMETGRLRVGYFLQQFVPDFYTDFMGLNSWLWTGATGFTKPQPVRVAKGLEKHLILSSGCGRLA